MPWPIRPVGGWSAWDASRCQHGTTRSEHDRWPKPHRRGGRTVSMRHCRRVGPDAHFRRAFPVVSGSLGAPGDARPGLGGEIENSGSDRLAEAPGWVGQPLEHPEHGEGRRPDRNAAARRTSTPTAPDTMTSATMVCQSHIWRLLLSCQQATHLIGRQSTQVGQGGHVGKSENGPSPTVGFSADDHQRGGALGA